MLKGKWKNNKKLHQLMKSKKGLKISGRLEYPLYDLDPRISEFYLWHGTKNDTVPILTLSGMPTEKMADPHHSLYGLGMYFAENSSKSSDYTSKTSVRKMILFRVALGEIYYTKQQLIGLKFPNAADPLFPDKSFKTFDSVVADKNTVKDHGNNQVHREFILFETSQCYPEFVVTFKPR